MVTTKKLYRSKTNRVIAGVCGGIAEYVGADPTFIRILWILMTLLGGSGVLLYVIAYLIMPENSESIDNSSSNGTSNFRTIIGILLIVLGLALLSDTLGLFSFSELWKKSWEYILPICLIAVGIALLVRRRVVQQSQTTDAQSVPHNSESLEVEQQDSELYERLTRSQKDKKIFGICGGIAEYFHVDSTIVRLLYILFTFATGGVGVILYFLMALVIPQKQTAHGS